MSKITGKVISHTHAKTAKCDACYRPTNALSLYRVANDWRVCRRDLAFVRLIGE